MPCYRCGARQSDPERGASTWKRGVCRDRHVLICPACQSGRDWQADLDACGRCSSTHLVCRLGEIECRTCGAVRPAPSDTRSTVDLDTDTVLSDEVTRALDRILHGRGRVPG